MPKTSTAAATAKPVVPVEVPKRKPLDEMTKEEMVKADIYPDIIEDRFPE